MKKWLLGAGIMTFTLVLMCMTAFAEDKTASRPVRADRAFSSSLAAPTPNSAPTAAASTTGTVSGSDTASDTMKPADASLAADTSQAANVSQAADTTKSSDAATSADIAATESTAQTAENVSENAPEKNNTLKTRLLHMAAINRVFDDDIFNDDALIRFAAFHLKAHEHISPASDEIPTDTVKAFIRDFYGLEVTIQTETVKAPKDYGHNFKLTARSLQKTDMGYRLNAKIEFLDGDRVIGTTGLMIDFRTAAESPYGFTLEYARLTD